jgi:hypothetical protein
MAGFLFRSAGIIFQFQMRCPNYHYIDHIYLLFNISSLFHRCLSHSPKALQPNMRQIAEQSKSTYHDRTAGERLELTTPAQRVLRSQRVSQANRLRHHGL